MARIFCDPKSVWADAVPLKLPADGALLALMGLNGETLDSFAYTMQSENISNGRIPNGTGSWAAQAFSTPGQPNHPALTNAPMFNELLVRNQTGTPNPWASRSGWLEVKNPTAAPVSLAGWKLRPATDPNDLAAWTIPVGVILPASGYLAISCDSIIASSTADSLHLNFSHRLDMARGLELLTPQGEVADRLFWGRQLPDKSIGRNPSGVWTLQSVTTRGTANSPTPTVLGSAATLKINEWNGRSFLDVVEFSEFIELYNPDETKPVDLSGLWLGDDPSEAGRRGWQIPPLTFIGPRGFAVFDPAVYRSSPYVYPFRIDSSGEYLRLSQNDASITRATRPHWEGLPMVPPHWRAWPRLPASPTPFGIHPNLPFLQSSQNPRRSAT
jgi:hypothetical protein